MFKLDKQHGIQVKTSILIAMDMTLIIKNVHMREKLSLQLKEKCPLVITQHLSL